jgi:hypothetical protein
MIKSLCWHGTDGAGPGICQAGAYVGPCYMAKVIAQIRDSHEGRASCDRSRAVVTLARKTFTYSLMLNALGALIALCMQGIQPNLLKMIPAAAIHWMAFDALKRAMGV